MIEVNPRVSRSSALASKATGFPIAKIAALLAVGCTLDEITNDITGATPASFEPALDYVVVKVPRFDFAKFPAAPPVLGTTMRSVGEAMAIGRTFPEALQKALRSLETGRAGLNADPGEAALDRARTRADLDDALVARPRPTGCSPWARRCGGGAPVEDVAAASGYDPWFVHQIGEIVGLRARLEASDPEPVRIRRGEEVRVLRPPARPYLGDDRGGDVRAAADRGPSSPPSRRWTPAPPSSRRFTPYMYSTYEEEDEVPPSDRPRVMVLGSGPNRIGQGIEFDYCCVHAAFALRDAGYETIMVNCNPETVSTDYDTSDRLYFEPLTAEDVLEVARVERPDAVVVQLGGQTPLKLARRLEAAGVNIAGTSPESIDIAEDRERFAESVPRARDQSSRPTGPRSSRYQAEEVIDRIGFPVLVRPSYVLGGRAMRVVYSYDELADALAEIERESELEFGDAPLLIDRFLEAATEVDVDAVFDGHELLVGGVMEHVEEAGVHSGDSACIVPPPTLSRGGAQVDPAQPPRTWRGRSRCAG